MEYPQNSIEFFSDCPQNFLETLHKIPLDCTHSIESLHRGLHDIILEISFEFTWFLPYNFWSYRQNLIPQNFVSEVASATLLVEFLESLKRIVKVCRIFQKNLKLSRSSMNFCEGSWTPLILWSMQEFRDDRRYFFKFIKLSLTSEILAEVRRNFLDLLNLDVFKDNFFQVLFEVHNESWSSQSAAKVCGALLKFRISLKFK